MTRDRESTWLWDDGVLRITRTGDSVQVTLYPEYVQTHGMPSHEQIVGRLASAIIDLAMKVSELDPGRVSLGDDLGSISIPRPGKASLPPGPDGKLN